MGTKRTFGRAAAAFCGAPSVDRCRPARPAPGGWWPWRGCPGTARWSRQGSTSTANRAARESDRVTADPSVPRPVQEGGAPVGRCAVEPRGLRAAGPGELLGAELRRGRQVEPAGRVVEQVSERRRDVTRPDAAVGDRVTADLRQAQAPGGQHGRAGRHRLQHRQSEALTEARVGDEQRAAEETGQPLEGQVAGPDHPQPPRDRVQRPLHLAVPARLAGQHQRGRIRPADARLGEAADQRRHVLARLQRAEERHVVGIAEAEAVAHRPHLRRGRRMEPFGVHAVRHDVQHPRIGGRDPNQFRGRRLCSGRRTGPRDAATLLSRRGRIGPSPTSAARRR